MLRQGEVKLGSLSTVELHARELGKAGFTVLFVKALLTDFNPAVTAVRLQETQLCTKLLGKAAQFLF